MAQGPEADAYTRRPTPYSAPTFALPKGGGAIRGLGEKFAANPVTGTGSLTVPIYASTGRSGFGPGLALTYDSGAGNGAFGFGWSLSLPAVTRKTDKGLPLYRDGEESDVFVLSGAEDLVPVLRLDGSRFVDSTSAAGYTIQRYRPRVEGLFARIERWTHQQTGESHWRSISRDNVTTLYGQANNSRIFDPDDPNPAHPTRVFAWLICASYDDKGNAVTYEYKSENSDRVDQLRAHERNRTHETRAANRYLKRIKYGNRISRLIQPDLSQAEWMFELVFDYGEHVRPLPADETDAPSVTATPAEPEQASWGLRPDAFSSYRAGFEVRTYRRCERVLMFHHFPGEAVGSDCLVRSTEFDYAESPLTHFSFLRAVTQCGYVREEGQTFRRKSMPPLELEYSQAAIQHDVREVDQESLDNLPMGLDGGYQWVDLDGEGVSGILTEQADRWLYKRNLSPLSDAPQETSRQAVARFGPVELVAVKPALAFTSGLMQFMDLAGDGQADLVQLDGPARGFYERAGDTGWAPFRPFAAWPNVDPRDPNLKFVDLTGDGHADILITESEAVTWHASLAEEGFGRASRCSVAADEERGPRLVIADGTEAIYLADLSGDGLTDLVRVRNGEVCYWPNLGYGRFGSKVTMDDAPWFDAPDQFDQRRIRLIDVDGSGLTDIVYLRRDGAQVFFNLSGNGWAAAQAIPFPKADDAAEVQAVDLLGNGTACLVWSSSLPGDARRQMRYVDLMGGKPHLLTRVVNNLGAETVISYAASTRFYLEDKAAGTPWITRLPFPVHVVERVETFDRISRNWFVTRYRYHHGYFDGAEREFHGFGMVEQFDTAEFNILKQDSDARLGQSANIDASSHVPPTWTKTWFHTGAFVDREHISTACVREYYREPNLSDEAVEALLLDDTVLPPLDLSAEEEREACRALKGSMLRQEVYAKDGSTRSGHPYRVSERNYTIELVQGRGINRHAVFLFHPRETLDYHYERDPADPRVSHSLALHVDRYGNVCKALAIGYGRRPGRSPLEGDDRARQEQLLISYTEEDFTNAIDRVDDISGYRTPLPCETRTYELTGFGLTPPAQRFRFSDFVDESAEGEERFAALLAMEEIDYATRADPARKQKRLVELVRTVYRSNDLAVCLSLGALESRALPCESYRLSFTPGLLDLYAPKVAAPLLAAILREEGKYADLDEDNRWWTRSGRVFFHPDPAATAADELAEASAHFFVPRRYRDAFGDDTIASYDEPAAGLARRYDLLLTRTVDAAGNEVQAENDYRVLQPARVTDHNGNRTEVAFDALGLVVGTAVAGKFGEGDSLADFRSELSVAEIDAFFAAPRLPSTSAAEHPAAPLLRNATTRIVYDVDRYRRRGEPVSVITLARETHVSDLRNDERTKIQVTFGYSDGFGREIQKKIQAEPLLDSGVPDVDPRWVGSGWTIFNNKGQPVRKYEPFFSPTHQFEFGRAVGVSATLFYDPLARVVVTLHPDQTYEKVVFDPWRQATWDTNDTAGLDPRADPDIRGFVDRYFASEPPDWTTWLRQRIDPQDPPEDSPGLAPERAAAVRALKHAGTPAVAHFDALGRAFLTIADNGFAPDGTSQQYATRVHLDIEGNQRAVTDARGRDVMRYEYDMLGERISQVGMDGGARWVVNDVAGAVIRAWDSRDHASRSAYDALHRLTHVYVWAGGAEEALVERIVYGERHPDAAALNCRGRPYQHYDGAGVMAYEGYDFKGNVIRATRTLAREYRAVVDWSPLAHVTEIADVVAAAAPLLESESFSSRTWFDALNRPIQLCAPHSSLSGRMDLVRRGYSDANLLERLDVWPGEGVEPEGLLAPDSASLEVVRNADYNARGQRILTAYGNGATTSYEYDERTFRLRHLQTRRPDAVLQDLEYTYDPAGNITHVRDAAQQTIYFDGEVVEPGSDYRYDAIYRLIEAKGREHRGQAGNCLSGDRPDWHPHYDFSDCSRTRLAHPHDGQAMRHYTEACTYDEVGNLLAMDHVAGGGSWTRRFEYARDSNRLLSSSLPGDGDEAPYSARYGYDAHGNMTGMPHLTTLEWDFKDQLHVTQQQAFTVGTGERTYYVYDAAGQRVRKVTDYAAEDGSTPQRKSERIYLGGFEIYRTYSLANAGPTLERETLHVMDDRQRVALVETRTAGHDGSPAQLTRYQFGNHLDSALLELDESADVISYEEYYPYGSTSYQALRGHVEVGSKRYRYTGRERDEESGFYYHGARYYASWLGRWTSCDPSGTVDGANIYSYVAANPTNYRDPHGLQSLAEILGQPSGEEQVQAYLTGSDPRDSPAEGGPVVLSRSGDLALSRPDASPCRRGAGTICDPLVLERVAEDQAFWESASDAAAEAVTLGVGHEIEAASRGEGRRLLQLARRRAETLVNPVGALVDLARQAYTAIAPAHTPGERVSQQQARGALFTTAVVAVPGIVGGLASRPSAPRTRVRPSGGPRRGGPPAGGNVPPQGGWRNVRLATASSMELRLWEDVLNAPSVAIGRTAKGMGHLHAALRAAGHRALVLDNWLRARGITWTQRWQDVFNRALYDRAALMRRPVEVMAGGPYTLGEATAAEAGARTSGIPNVPYWPKSPKAP